MVLQDFYSGWYAYPSGHKHFFENFVRCTLVADKIGSWMKLSNLRLKILQ